MIKIFDELNLTYPYSIDFNEDTQKFEIKVLVRTEDSIKNRPRNKVGYRGITINSSGNYRVRLQINKVKYEKTFKFLENAVNYRQELEEKYHKKEEIICPM